IGEKRPDGFHDLESIFVPLALCDTLRFERIGTGEDVLSLHSEIAGLSIKPEENLVLKALSLFRRHTGFDAALSIRLEKRIPAGAGLGGGSSDAASALLALNLLAGKPLSLEELSPLAALLGSDVPFFLAGGTAFVAGRGERVQPVKSPGALWVLLVKPPFSSDTARSYRLLDEYRELRPAREESLSREVLIQALEQDPRTWPFRNDFLPVFLEGKGANAAAYRSILEGLREAGALFSGLSGSGSCCFGVFAERKMVERAEKELSKGKNYTNCTFFLAQKPDAVLEY
ncbi:MAG: 4-(cytidine 5'-diphospho)-2-C-methyl-D-erythritol kinase, partial [Treponema sp.]|nr:4-(cytidine 5'-diphospho)-2-C-methyl-D-erythritol kinase [Treponema sp.]